MTTAAAAPPAETEAPFQHLPTAVIVPSKTNPRTHFDDAYLAELAGSIREKGLIQPIVVRPLDGLRAIGRHPEKAAQHPKLFEIVAGECRYRASKLAGLVQVPAIVRAYTDAQVLETQLEENIHRKDLTPLEEAVGYRRLIDSNPTKHSAETIATRIGMSVGYVWDRLKLNDLIPEAKRLLEANRFTVGHAILLSRLKPADQERAIDPDSSVGRVGAVGGLWASDHSRNFLTADEEKRAGKYDDVKPVSIREFDGWIQRHVRFDVAHAATAQPLVFEATAAQVDAAAGQPGRGRKVIAITHEYRVADDARAEERTYGSQSWERADGQAKSKTCEHSVLGVVVAGPGQGDTLRVCVARDRCRVHFAAVVKQKEHSANLRASGKGKQAARNEANAVARTEAELKAKEKQDAEERRQWKKAVPEIEAAILAQVKAAPVPTLIKLALAEARDAKADSQRLLNRPPKNADETLRVLALGQALRGVDNEYWGRREVPGRLKRFGLDIGLAAILATHAPPAPAAAESKPAAKAKAGKKR